MSSFVGLYTAFSGLQAGRAGLDVASHNVANAGTDGYTRQRVELRTRNPYRALFGDMGQGVDIAGISRARDALLDARVRSATADAAKLDVMTGLLDRVEVALGEPDNGTTAALGRVWDAFEALALDPTSTAARSNVIGALDGLAATIESIATEWSGVAEGAAADLGTRVDRVNVLLDEVAGLNQSILEAEADGTAANDLQDRRDGLLDELSQLAGVNVSVDSQGMARVSIEGLALVSGVEVSHLTYDPATATITHPAGATVRPGGELAGFTDFLTTELPTLRAELDTFTATIADALNTRHAAGWVDAATPGGPLLTYTPGDAAATVALASSNPAELAAAGSPGPPFPVYDGSNAANLAALRLDPAVGGLTLDQAFQGIVGTVGSRVASTAIAADSQRALASSAEMQRLEAHGVSIDEEMVAMLTYQRAYEAASRVMTAIDEALDTLVNRTGMVGR